MECTYWFICGAHEIPRIEARWACIAPYTASSDFGKDGYFARVLGDRGAHKINNALSGIQPEDILLLGLTEIEQGYLRALLPNERLIEVDSVLGVLKHLPFKGVEDGFVACKQPQIIEGLLLAKFAHKPSHFRILNAR